MDNGVSEFKEGIWTVKGDTIIGDFQQGIWEIKARDIEYFMEIPAANAADQAGIQPGVQLLIKTYNISQPYLIGVYSEGSSRMIEVIRSYADNFKINYQAGNSQTPAYQPAYGSTVSRQGAYQQNQYPQGAQYYQQDNRMQPGYGYGAGAAGALPYKKKKSSAGKIFAFSILAILILAIGYGVYWFIGIKSIGENFAMPSNPNNTAMESLYADKVSKASGGVAGEIVLNKEESKYFTGKLNSETTFFNFDNGSTARVERMVMYPAGNNIKLELVVNIKTGLPIIGARSPERFFHAAVTSQTAYGNLLGVSSEMEVRDTADGMAFKPITLSVGNSPMPVGVAMTLLRQFAPGIDISADGFINFKPIDVFDNNGQKLFSITGFKIENNNLIIETN